MMDIVHKLLRHISISDSNEVLPLESEWDQKYRESVIEKIIQIVSTDLYSRLLDFEWYLNILRILCLASQSFNNGPGELICNEIREIAIRVENVRKFAVDIASNLIDNGCTYTGIAWICGEYAKYLEDPKLVVERLFASKEKIAATVPAVLKIIAEWPDLMNDNTFRGFLIKKLDDYACDSRIQISESASIASKLVSLTRTNKQNASCTKVMSEIKVFWSDTINPVAIIAQKKVPVPEGLDLDELIYDDFMEVDDTPEVEEVVEKQKFAETEENLRQRKKERAAKQKDDPFYIRDTVQDLVDEVDDELVDIPIISLTDSDIKEIERKTRKSKKKSAVTIPTKTFSVNRDVEMPDGVVPSQHDDNLDLQNLDPDTYAVLSVDLTADPPQTVVQPTEEKPKKIEEKKKTKKVGGDKKKKSEKKKEKEPKKTGKHSFFKTVFSDEHAVIQFSWKHNKIETENLSEIKLTLRISPLGTTKSVDILLEPEIPSGMQLEKHVYVDFPTKETQNIDIVISVSEYLESPSIFGHLSFVGDIADAQTRSTMILKLPPTIYLLRPSKVTISPFEFTRALQSATTESITLASASFKFSLPKKFNFESLAEVTKLKVVEVVGPAASVWGQDRRGSWVAGLIKIDDAEVLFEVKGLDGKIVQGIIKEVEEWVMR